MSFPGGSVVKNLPGMQEPWVDPWVRKVPWKKAWQPTLVFLLRKSHGHRSLAGYSPWGWKGSNMTESTEHICTTRKKYIYQYTNKVSESCSVVSDSLRLHGLYSPWNSPGQNTDVGNLSLLQGIFLNQEPNWGLLPCRQILYQLSYQGSPLSTPEIWLISKRWEANEVGLMDQTAAQNSTHKLEAMKNRSRAGCAVSVNVAVIGNWGAVRIMGSHLECIEQPDDSILSTPTLCPTPPPIRIKHFLLDCSRQLVWMLKLVLLVLMVTSDK